ncbi:NADH dehydrogenase (ubiquinone) [Fusarium albosuccineum]|uniref:NADH dehydrogenase (Ubiquinone) n=1 Tax=Fusarium albosuccineum TaxID=1237068 RepID=A0A8H4PCB0_9HYPO|nr:NADH dehydrogenase (ubiquinone) [Fusarium albosuccineum]
MRYGDWDVLLFPLGGGIPFREFQVACNLVHDTEFPNLPGFFTIPTVSCCVPSLAPGASFQISIHSWDTPPISPFTTRSYAKHLEDVKFEMRLFIDGRLVASTSINRTSSWPHVIANSFDFAKKGELEPLKFPVFRQEILQQDDWSPADDLGRIKLVISEGFPRDSLSMPMERVKNVVAFSFLHAPQGSLLLILPVCMLNNTDVLERSGIAWPNPFMTLRAPSTTSKPVPSLPPSNVNSHAHSPRRQAKERQRAMSRITMPMFQDIMPHAPTAIADGLREDIYIMPLPNTDEMPSCSDISNPFDDSKACFDWSGNGDLELNDILQPAVASSQGTNIRGHSSSARRASGYVPHGTQLTELPFSMDGEDCSRHMKVPANTPTGRELKGDNFAGLTSKSVVLHDVLTEQVHFPAFPHHAVLPDDFAYSLTTSLLNQPAPYPAHGPSSRTSTPQVRSRKENRKRHTTCPIPSSFSTAHGLEHQDQRKVSQQMYMPSNGSIPVPLTQPHLQSPGSTYSPLARFSNAFASTQSSPKAPSSVDAILPVDKGAKRTRNFTPGSANTLDGDEEEHRRASPRVRLTPSSEGKQQVGS